MAVLRVPAVCSHRSSYFRARRRTATERPPVDLSRGCRRCARRHGGDIVVGRSPRGRILALGALYSDRSQIALRMLTTARASRRRSTRLVMRRSSRAIAFRWTLRIDATAYRLVHGEADSAAVADRRIATATTSSLRRCRRHGSTCCRHRRLGARLTVLAPSGILGPKRSAGPARSKGLEQRVDVLAGEVPGQRRRSSRPAVRVRRRPAPRAEDRAVPRSA